MGDRSSSCLPAKKPFSTRPRMSPVSWSSSTSRCSVATREVCPGDLRARPGKPGNPRGLAYDKVTDADVGAVEMPDKQTGSPMTYMLNGKQYIVVAVSGGNHSGEFLAFRLPK